MLTAEQQKVVDCIDQDFMVKIGMELTDIFSPRCFSKKPAFHIAGVIEKAPRPIHISPFRAERIVFHTDGLLHVDHD